MKSFLDLINSVIRKETGTFDVLVLKGFNNNILKEVAQSIPHALDKLPLDTKDLLDLGKIQKCQNEIISGVGKATKKKTRLLDFESFIQIAGNSDIDELGKQFLVIENNLLEDYPNQSNCSAEDFEDSIHADKEIPDDSPFYKFYSNATLYKGLTLVQYIDGFEDEFENVRSVKLFTGIEPELLLTPPDITNADVHFQFQQLSKEYLDIKIGIYSGKKFKNIHADVEDSIMQQKVAFTELQLFASVLKSLQIKSAFYVHSSKLSDVFRPELLELLRKYWCSEEFRTLYVYKNPDISTELTEVSQAAIIEEVIHQFENGKDKKYVRDILLTAPTGAGKSLLFQLPAMYLAEKYKAVTIVISPLIALMKDQVIALKTVRN